MQLKAGDTLRVGEATMQVKEVGGSRVRVAIQAKRSILIRRV